LGLDSIRALHLAERLQRRLKRPVEPVMLFQNPTVERLAQALAEIQEVL
jgi:aryl carrier-like protein